MLFKSMNYNKLSSPLSLKSEAKSPRIHYLFLTKAAWYFKKKGIKTGSWGWMASPGTTKKGGLRTRFKPCHLEFSFASIEYWALTYQLREVRKVVTLQYLLWCIHKAARCLVENQLKNIFELTVRSLSVLLIDWEGEKMCCVNKLKKLCNQFAELNVSIRQLALFPWEKLVLWFGEGCGKEMEFILTLLSRFSLEQ